MRNLSCQLKFYVITGIDMNAKSTRSQTEIKSIALAEIRPSSHNPRGKIVRDASFSRLADSISREGVIVPLVVARLASPVAGVNFELIDGERRYWAAREVAVKTVPANILPPGYSQEQLRTLMFHIHMNREQWGALAQLRSLEEIHPVPEEGLPFDDKELLSKQLADSTTMSLPTARDRVHVLAWPKPLKERLYTLGADRRKNDVYSYALAIEVSIVEPSRKAFPVFYNHGKDPIKGANTVRTALWSKVESGLRTGVVTNRDQIRNIAPLFSEDLSPEEHEAAERIFSELIHDPESQFDDIRAEMQSKLPEIAVETVQKPSRLIASANTLRKALEQYGEPQLQAAIKSEDQRDKARREFAGALSQLKDCIDDFLGRIGA